MQTTSKINTMPKKKHVPLAKNRKWYQANVLDQPQSNKPTKTIQSHQPELMYQPQLPQQTIAILNLVRPPQLAHQFNWPIKGTCCNLWMLLNQPNMSTPYARTNRPVIPPIVHLAPADNGGNDKEYIESEVADSGSASRVDENQTAVPVVQKKTIAVPTTCQEMPKQKVKQY
jgi:ribosomal protein S30